jgi:hypothetical protein
MPSYGERDSLMRELRDIERRLRALETQRGADGTGSGGTGPVGPTGPPGPTAVSTDAGNFAYLGSDSLLFVRHPDLVPINVQFNSYTLTAADVGKMIPMVNSSAMTLTLPLTATVAWPPGGRVSILAGDVGMITVTPDSGVTVNGTPSLVTRAQWSVIHVMKRGTESWVVWGDLA